ncbi:MAG: HNH endonuclease, partial [Bacteroidetes bacterium]|nr:HNH endonuclease [Bacteroidota bacterium]
RMSIEHSLWREAVFSRDGWTCQKCEELGIKLHPHHIQNFAQFPELRFAIDNGVTLCKKCHIKFHKKYGYRNNTAEQLERFLATRYTHNKKEK